MRLFVARSCHLFGIRKVPALGGTMSMKLPFYVYIFKLPLVDDRNRPFAAKPSHDLLFIKLWAATLRMPEMEKACRKHQNGQV